MRAQIVKMGRGLAVRIPRTVANQAKLKPGDFVDVGLSAEGAIVLHREFPILSQYISQITPENRYKEISAGRIVGKENIEW